MKHIFVGFLVLALMMTGCSSFSSTPAVVTVVVVVTPTNGPISPLAPITTPVPRVTFTPTGPAGIASPSSIAPTRTLLPQIANTPALVITSTPLPPTGTATQIVSITCSGKPEDTGKVGLIVASFIGGIDQIQFTIGGKMYPIDPMSRICIDLMPGNYSWTASRRGTTSGNGTKDISLAHPKDILNLCLPEDRLTDRCAPPAPTPGGGAIVPTAPPPPTPTQDCCAMIHPGSKWKSIIAIQTWYRMRQLSWHG